LDETYTPFFTFDFTQGWVDIQIRGVIGISVHIITVIGILLAVTAWKIYKYKRNIVKIEPLLGTVWPKDKK